MKKFIYTTTALLLTFSLVFVSCEDDRPEPPGGISGTVIDQATGNPLNAAHIRLQTGATATSGNDGFFQFSELEAGEYTLTVTRTGFSELRGYLVTVRPGQVTQRNVPLERLPPSLQIMSATTPPVPIDTLDFGSALADVTRSFNIFNDGPERLEWDLTYTAVWITSTNVSSGTLDPGASRPVVVTIDREALSSGANVTTIHVTSNNGVRDLVVTATDGRVRPTLNKLEPTDVTSTTAMFHGEILTAGTPAYTERGFVFSRSPMPTSQTTIARLTAPLTENRNFSAMATGLTLGQTYFARAFATNSLGTTYSANDIQFSPISTTPTLTTQDVTNINIANGTATFNGTIVSAGDPAYTERGFVFGTTPNPTSANIRVVAPGSGALGTFSLAVSDIREGEIYYVRAFATNVNGTEYSTNQVSLNFVATMPTVTTQAITTFSIAAGTATFVGNITSAGDLPILERGFVYATTPNPTSANIRLTAQGTGTGAFSLPVTDIQEGETYYVRAFVRNANGTEYGDQVILNFVAAMPTVTTQAITERSVANGTARFNGTLVSLGDLPIIERGFVFGTAPNPTVGADERILIPGSNTGVFVANATDLQEGRVYHVRAFATNANGTEYGENVTVDFNAIMPTLGTTSVTARNFAERTATFSGSVTTVGDLQIIERGFVYSTTISLPTLGNSARLPAAGTGEGTFFANATSLTQGATYHIRPFVTNSAGTEYGNAITFDFNAIPPTLSTGAPTINLAEQSVVFHGSILTVGDPPYTQRGFVYGRTNTPIVGIDSTVTVSGSGITGPFNIFVDNIPFGGTYFVRSFAIDYHGIARYGEVQSFNFNPIAATVTTQVPTFISPTIARFNGTITNMGTPTYTERGFVFSRNQNPETTNDATRVVVPGVGSGPFSIEVPGLDFGVQMFVRAYVISEAGVRYGQQVSFTLQHPNISVFQGIMVTSADIGGNINWTNANMECNNLTLGGFSDWRLPTLSELVAMAAVRTIDPTPRPPGMFSRAYWSSGQSGTNRIAVLMPGSGSTTSSPTQFVLPPTATITNSPYLWTQEQIFARCVRTITP